MVFPEGRWIALAQVDFDGTNLSRIPDKKMQGCVLSRIRYNQKNIFQLVRWIHHFRT